MKLTIEEIVRKLHISNPIEEKSLLSDCRFPLKFLNDGAYRNTYVIPNTSVIIKIPKTREYTNDNGTKSIAHCLNHAREEQDAIKQIKRKNSKYKFLQPYLPEIYYTNYTSGIVAMKRYFKIGSKNHRTKVKELEAKLCKLQKDQYAAFDLDNEGNWACDKDGSLKLIDFGCFFGG